jgi:hypothetical protein
MKTQKDSNKSSKASGAAKIRRILDYYDKQSDAQGAKEIENAPGAPRVAWLEVPTPLVPQVRKLIAKYRKSA